MRFVLLADPSPETHHGCIREICQSNDVYNIFELWPLNNTLESFNFQKARHEARSKIKYIFYFIYNPLNIKFDQYVHCVISSPVRS